MSCPKTSPQDNGDSENTVNKKSETQYEKLMQSMHSDPKWLEEVSLGQRVGLYKFTGRLGNGNFSQVKLAVHQLTNERVAVKIVDKGKLDEKLMRMLNQEISTMESIHHPNLIRLYEVLETYSKLYLVMEFAGGGELYYKIKMLGKLEELVARQIFAQISSAVDHMHRKNIIHRDIKAENVFFSGPNRVKLGDFGFSIQLTEGKKTGKTRMPRFTIKREIEDYLKGRGQLLDTYCGSPPYSAPELLRDENYVGGPVDVWAMGILLYFMVVGRKPFGGENVKSLVTNVSSGLYSIPKNLSKECAKLIDAILRQKPSERLTVSEILASEWLQGIQLPVTPEPKQSFILTPTIPKYAPPGETSNVQLSEIEITARERLTELGITSQLLASQSSLGSRSHVIGCYRLAIYKVQKQMEAFLDTESFAPTTGQQWTKPRQAKSPEKKFLPSSFALRKQGSESLFTNCWRRKLSSDSESEEEVGDKGNDRKERLSLEGRVSLFRHREFTSATEKGTEDSTLGIMRSSTCAIL